MRKRAVIDRIVDGEHAVILVGNEEQEIVYPAKELPPAAEEGSVLQVIFINGVIEQIELNETDTEQTRKSVMEQMKRLINRNRS